ncbi:MAG: polymer-forming cytoskeletal protein [Bacteroidales bacterium]|nr:polymer-forming cytoskeletal protein [Bacteroidales bacterium]
MANQFNGGTNGSAISDRDFTIIAKGTQILEGTLNSKNDIRIDGDFQGTVKTEAKLVLGDSSSVKADISCAEIDIYGKCECDKLVAHLVTLRTSSSFKGSIVAVELLIERGAVFNGSSQVVSEEEYNKLVGGEKKVVIPQPRPTPAPSVTTNNPVVNN